jgi:hypothetical protein
MLPIEILAFPYGLHAHLAEGATGLSRFIVTGRGDGVEKSPLYRVPFQTCTSFNIPTIKIEVRDTVEGIGVGEVVGFCKFNRMRSPNDKGPELP